MVPERQKESNRKAFTIMGWKDSIATTGGDIPLSEPTQNSNNNAWT